MEHEAQAPPNIHTHTLGPCPMLLDCPGTHFSLTAGTLVFQSAPPPPNIPTLPSPTPGTHFSLTAGTLVFQSGETRQVIRVPMLPFDAPGEGGI